MGQTGSEMKLQEAVEVKINRSSIFEPAEAGTGDQPLPCGTVYVDCCNRRCGLLEEKMRTIAIEDVDYWSKLVKIPFVFCRRLLLSR